MGIGSAQHSRDMDRRAVIEQARKLVAEVDALLAAARLPSIDNRGAVAEGAEHVCHECRS
jgi:hypothetical protein